MLPDGERNAWDDILDEVLRKAPPPYSFRRRHAHHHTAFPLRSSLAPQGHGSDGFSRPRPRSPPIAPSPPKAPAPTSYDGGYTGRSSGDEIDANHEIRGQQGASSKERPQSWALAPKISRSDPFSEPIEAITAGLAKKTAPRLSSQVTRSAEESLRERIAKLGARRPRPEGNRDSARRVGALSLRSYGSLTSGIDDGNADPLRSPPMSSRGGGGVGGLGSPSSAANLFFTQEALGNLSDQMASLRLSAEENRENRKQVMTRRLSRGGSFGIRRSLARDSADPAEGEAGEAGEAAAAEAAALGASPAAARAAADAAIAEARASRHRSARARSRSGAAAEAEPGLDHEGNDLVGHTRSSTFGQTELHVPEPDPSGASEEGYGARDDQGLSSSASSLLGKQDDLVDGWPGGSDAATEDGRMGRVPAVDLKPRLSELEQAVKWVTDARWNRE